MNKKITEFQKNIFRIVKAEKKKSTCLRTKIGAVIVKNNKIISKGYNGNPESIPSCKILGCAKKYFNPRHGQRNEMCTGLCAEQRAILNALKKKEDLKDATLYCSYSPCVVCARIITELNFKKIYYKKEYNDPLSKQIFKLAGIELIKI